VDRARFADKIIAELRHAGDTGPLEFDEEQFRLIRGEGNFLNLHNAFTEWERAPRLKRKAVLRYFATSLLSPTTPPDSIDEARANLMMRVRDREWCETMRLQFPTARDGKGPVLTYERINGELVLELVYDWPTAVSSIAPEQLDGWGITLEEAVRTARANLRERTPGTFAQLEPGVFASAWHDTYDSSRLVLTELISRLDVRGDPVALLPHRDHLFVTGANDESGLGRVAELARPLLDEPHRVTGRAFVWRDGAWQPFVPADGHPHRRRFLDLVRVTDAANYEEQKQALEEQARARGDDVFVASVLVATDPASGETTTVCSWTEGVPTLLPRADRIAFVSPGEAEETSIVYVPWDDALALMSGAMTAQGIDPERWRVDRFPTDDEQSALRRAEVDWPG
jgi:hypothetical protein